MPSTSPAAIALAGLRRDGRLLPEYPLVCRLTASLPPAERGRVGQWLRAVGSDDVARCHPGVVPLRIAVTGNSTLAPLAAHLIGNAVAVGMTVDVQVTDFGQYREQLLARDSELYSFAPLLAVCLLDAYAVFDEIPVPWTVADVVRTLERRLVEIRGLGAAFAAQTPTGVLVLNTMPLPRLIAHQLIDYQSRAALGAAWRRFCADLLDVGVINDRVVCVDLEVLADEAPMAADAQLSAYAHQRLPEGVLAAYANEVVHLGKNLAGRAKKCLVLDLDETLWGGVLAEDGVDGIDLGGDLEGGAFSQLQGIVKQLGSQGVLLAICSKNDSSDVLAVLRDRPDMVLREEDFVAVRANWRPKSDNLSELAAELNLGQDSLVFVDDSPFECELVRHNNPAVTVIHADGDPATRAATVLADSWFTGRVLTDEDRGRRLAYRTEIERQTFLGQSPSLAGFLEALDLQVRLGPARADELGRLAQLTQRTNQFNLTTQRLDLADVATCAQGPGTDALAIAARDRFGDHGVVGAAFTSISSDGEELVIDNFLLSCRVFSRGIETACLYEVLRWAKAAGRRRVIATYRPSAKNGKVAGLYSDHGFDVISAGVEETTFVHHLDVIPPGPSYITLAGLSELAPMTT